jgi:hypothetical protein
MAKTQLSLAATPGRRYAKFLVKSAAFRRILFDEEGNLYFRKGKFIRKI